MATEITAGADVFTSNGDKIGQVAEVRGDAFRVNASMMPDYWLPDERVDSIDASRIRVDFSRDSLGEYKIDEPAAA